MISDIARVKVNLTLKCGKLDHQGLHPVSGLVAFTRFGDRLWLDPDQSLALTVSGRFAEDMEISNKVSPGGNLVLKAARAWFALSGLAVKGHFYLEKNIPLASGLGGGSADAAAALRVLARAHDMPLSRLGRIAFDLGADVPMCVRSRSCFVSGYGNQLGNIVDLPDIFVLLVNPSIKLATKTVFETFDSLSSVDHSSAPHRSEPVSSFEQLNSVLKRQGNDLYPAAASLAPELEAVMACLNALPDVQFAGMSGSGATCFALFCGHSEAERAGELVRKRYPAWWARTSQLV